MYLFGNFFAGVLIFRAQFFFGIVFVEVFKAESLYRHVRTAHVFPVGYLFVENLLYLLCVKPLHSVCGIYGQHVAFFDNRVAEQSHRFGEKKSYYEQYYNACNESAYREHPSGYNIYQLFHDCYCVLSWNET